MGMVSRNGLAGQPFGCLCCTRRVVHRRSSLIGPIYSSPTLGSSLPRSIHLLSPLVAHLLPLFSDCSSPRSRVRVADAPALTSLRPFPSGDHSLSRLRAHSAVDVIRHPL